ncbi:hypothetical protein G4B88_015100 [Cannabis sativa]|uniref:RNase H type-1 domain-containing protein n=1 Tax=Cannabis sativa TaxID=3483 RepID=A0A7J6DKU4_CANSA|nr:hypothetical protein G4B88_015100 [Cannabis sativa]
MKRIIFLCDNLCVAKSFVVSAHDKGDFRIQEALARFKDCCSKFEEWDIYHISRTCNFIAHNIAKWAAVHQKSGRIEFDELPGGVLDDFREWDPGPTLTI